MIKSLKDLLDKFSRFTNSLVYDGGICKRLYKEVIISLANGLLFALVIGVVAYLWFKIPLLGFVIAASMIINLFSAGFFNGTSGSNDQQSHY